MDKTKMNMVGLKHIHTKKSPKPYSFWMCLCLSNHNGLNYFGSVTVHYIVYYFLFWKMKTAKLLWFGSCLQRVYGVSHRRTLSLHFCFVNGLQTSHTVSLLCTFLKPLKKCRQSLNWFYLSHSSDTRRVMYHTIIKLIIVYYTSPGAGFFYALL